MKATLLKGKHPSKHLKTLYKTEKTRIFIFLKNILILTALVQNVKNIQHLTKFYNHGYFALYSMETLGITVFSGPIH